MVISAPTPKVKTTAKTLTAKIISTRTTKFESTLNVFLFFLPNVYKNASPCFFLPLIRAGSQSEAKVSFNVIKNTIAVRNIKICMSIGTNVRALNMKKYIAITQIASYKNERGTYISEYRHAFLRFLISVIRNGDCARSAILSLMTAAAA